jgi:hypothetical protein
MRRFIKVMAPILVLVGIMGATPALAGAGNGNHYGRNGGNNGNHYGQNGGNNEIIPIPEPTTMLLVGSGLVGLAGLVVYRRRRMKK